MPKTTASEILDLGFTPEMFRKNDSTINAYIDAVIIKKSKILEGRIGSTSYASATSPTQDYVKRAEECIVAAELLQRRINVIVGNLEGAEGLDLFKIRRNREEYVEEAEALIQKIVSGVTADSSVFATGVLETSHFNETSSLGGLEIKI